MSADKYVVSDATQQEKDVPKRDNPLGSLVEAPKAEKTEEKAPEQPLTAGDKAAFKGQEEAVIEPPKNVVYGHCNNCRLELTEERVVKTPIDWTRNEDGTISRTANRFSVFCKQCMKFVCVIDKMAAEMLQNMIRKNIK
jgi:hypothetical protein